MKDNDYQLKDNIFEDKKSSNFNNYVDLFISVDQKLVNFDVGIALILCAACFYFSFVAINGNHGIKKKISLEFEALELRKNLTRLEDISFDLEEKANKLKGESLDLDLLDQQARKILGLIRPDEIIVVN